jgi:hypothetical protein
MQNLKHALAAIASITLSVAGVLAYALAFAA